MSILTNNHHTTSISNSWVEGFDAPEQLNPATDLVVLLELSPSYSVKKIKETKDLTDLISFYRTISIGLRNLGVSCRTFTTYADRIDNLISEIKFFFLNGFMELFNDAILEIETLRSRYARAISQKLF